MVENYDYLEAPNKIRISHLMQWKQDHKKWAMLTSYDYLTAKIFDQAHIPVLLVGDSAANVVYGYDSTIKLSLAELLPLIAGVSRGARRALVVADLPFGTYEASCEQAFHTAVQVMSIGGAQGVKIEGGLSVLSQIEFLVTRGIPVMGHIGFTPQSVHGLGGNKVQGKTMVGQEKLINDAKMIAAAGAFAIVLEMIPAQLAAEITAAISIPTIGIGAGNGTDAQILVWQDMAGLHLGRTPKFVKQYSNFAQQLTLSAQNFLHEVIEGKFPDTGHSFTS